MTHETLRAALWTLGVLLGATLLALCLRHLRQARPRQEQPVPSADGFDAVRAFADLAALPASGRAR